MTPITLDKRMKAVANCVREGAVIADIGTDHGKLPIYLVQTGRAKRAIASDINRLPLEKAKGNIEKYGLNEKIDTILTDGLSGIERFSPTDVVIAGMGGEMIADILENSTVKKEGVRFVLQPMTKEGTLREYLTNNGYLIYDENIVKERKIYQIICAEYTGEKYILTPAEILLGRKNIEKEDELFGEFAQRVIEITRGKIEGKKRAGLNIDEEMKTLFELEEILKRYRGLKI